MGLPVAGSSLVTSTSPRRIVIVERGGKTSATTNVPRIATTAFGVWISMVWPGFMAALLTATAVRPAARVTVDVAGTSVIVRLDRSRAVTVALPPSRTRTADLSPVTIRSRRKTPSLNLSSAGARSAARATVAVPISMATTPTGGSSDDAGNGHGGIATVSTTKRQAPRARRDRVRGGSRVSIDSQSRACQSAANQGSPANSSRVTPEGLVRVVPESVGRLTARPAARYSLRASRRNGHEPSDEPHDQHGHHRRRLDWRAPSPHVRRPSPGREPAPLRDRP